MQRLLILIFMMLIFGQRSAFAAPSHHGAQQSPQRKKTNDGTLEGQWYLQPLLSSDTSTGKFPVLKFNVSSSSFSGNTGCNTMRGSFQKTDSSLQFNSNIMTTKMSCQGYDEAAFIKSLLRTNRYKIENGVLILMFDSTELSRWTRKPDRKVKMNKA